MRVIGSIILHAASCGRRTAGGSGALMMLAIGHWVSDWRSLNLPSGGSRFLSLARSHLPAADVARSRHSRRPRLTPLAAYFGSEAPRLARAFARLVLRRWRY